MKNAMQDKCYRTVGGSRAMLDFNNRALPFCAVTLLFYHWPACSRLESPGMVWHSVTGPMCAHLLAGMLSRRALHLCSDVPFPFC